MSIKSLCLSLFVGLGMLCACLGSPTQAFAQSIAVDYQKAHLSWTQATTGGVPTSYTVKCGTASGGPYTLTKSYPIAAPETVTAGIISISDVITTSGIFFCVVTAKNAIGESPNSSETTFQAGLTPTAPTAITVTIN